VNPAGGSEIPSRPEIGLGPGLTDRLLKPRADTTKVAAASPRWSCPLSTLTPATARDDATAFDLRYASRLMADAAAEGFTSEAALNSLRADAAIKLNAVARWIYGR